MAGLLWPDSSEENARGNLRHELWRLRKSLESEEESYFQVEDLTITFQSQKDFSLDINQLDNSPPERCTEDELISAVSVYQGELLPGFYDEWVIVERERLHTLFENKMDRLLKLLENEGRWPEILEWGTRWINFGQWPEPAYRAVMAAYAYTGDLAKAARTYERFSQRLQKDLGVKPSEQTQALYKRIRTGWKPAALPQVQEIEAPKSPSRSFMLPRVRRSNVPKPLTSFIGREKEIQQVEKLVSQSSLVTITGPGGVGKTRLAIQVASAMTSQFRDGVWWVELAGLFNTSHYPIIDKPGKKSTERRKEPSITPGEREEPEGIDSIAQAVVTALRIPTSTGAPFLEGMLDYLQDKQLLLVLDNCEHLIAA